MIPKTGQAVAAAIDGSTAHLSVTLQPQETRILATQSVRPPADTVSDWYGDLATTWKQSLPGHTVAYPAGLPVYYADFKPMGGKIVPDASVTPEHMAALSSFPTVKAEWDPALNGVRPQYAGVDSTPGHSVLYRWAVTTPPSWHPGDKYYLRPGFIGRVAYLNGKKVDDGGQYGRDVSSLLRFGGFNDLVIASNWDGYNAGASLWRQPAASASLSLAGPVDVWVDEAHGMVTSQLPGTFNGMFMTKTMTVPASWSKSHVFLRLQWDGAGHPRYLVVNGKEIFFDTGTPDYMDVTPWIKFGQSNHILFEPESIDGWQPGKVIINSAALERVDHL